MNNYTVVKREKGWAVIREGARRASSLHATQAEALQKAEVLTRKPLRVSRSNSDDTAPLTGVKKHISMEVEKAKYYRALGERIQNARKMRGGSLRSLAEKLEISHTTLQKYEKGLIPSDTAFICKLAKSLEVRTSYFLTPPKFTYTQVEWRKASKVGVKVQRQLEFEALDYFERYLQIEQILGIESQSFAPADFTQEKAEDIPEQIEAFTAKLRLDWGLGLNPLPNVHRMLEEQGVKVRILPKSEGFDGLASYLQGGANPVPVIALSDEYWAGDTIEDKDLPRFRFSALHELGHLLMKLPEGIEHRVKENLCHRFAAAFLFPKAQYFQSVGEKRRNLSNGEMLKLKAIWGMSIGAMMRRACDLGVITQGAYKGYCIRNRSRKVEPQTWHGTEESKRFEGLVLRAYAEEMISHSKAIDLLQISFGELAGKAESLI